MRNVVFLLSFLLVQMAAGQNQLFIPDTLSGARIDLNMRQGSVFFHPGKSSKTMGFNGNLLGPTLILKKHQNVTINVKNSLGEPTTVHWHGMHVASRNDGGPHTVIDTGKTWSPSFEVLDHASTHWYHPHLHEKTHAQVQMGLAGLIIVRDSSEAALPLPRTYGVDDIPMILQTKAFDANQEIITGTTALDTALYVNATRNPYIEVPEQVVRLRVLNGASERVFLLGLSDNREFFQIGSDGGLLKAPVKLTRLMLAPGERAELLVQLDGLSGNTVYLKNYGSEIPNAYYGARQPGMGAGQVIPNYSSNPLNGSDFNLVEMRVVAQKPGGIKSIPTSLVSFTPWAENSANTTRTLTFMSSVMGPGAINGPFMINNAHFDMSVINYRVPFNNTEIWELRNQTPIAHPFHIHNVHFFVLTVNGVTPPASLQGRKDVVVVPGGNGVVRFIAKFTDFYDDSIPYMYHCHMLTHEDHGMMGQFIVEPPCKLIQKSPESVNALPGNTVVLEVKTDSSVGIAFQWQSNVGFGFQNLDDAGQYSGTKTRILQISNVSLSNNNQLFRCKVNKGSCEEITENAALWVSSSNLRKISAKSDFLVYPVPAIDEICILTETPPIAYTLYNAEGRTIKTSIIHNNKTYISFKNLTAGIYRLRVEWNDGTIREKYVMKRD
jgi:bilirubin oxidase